MSCPDHDAAPGDAAPAGGTIGGMQTATRPTGTLSADAVRLTGLVKRFGTGNRQVTAVDGVDLAVRPGEIVAFLGPNGAGKTTTIDMMLGFSKPDEGSVEILDGTPT